MRFALVHRSIQRSQRVVRSAARPKTVRAVHKVLLVDCFEHFPDRVLYDLVLDRRDADRTSFPLLFRNVHASDRLMSPSPRPQPLVQAREIPLQFLTVSRLRDAIDPHRSILPQPVVGPLQSRYIDPMRQRKDLPRISLRS